VLLVLVLVLVLLLPVIDASWMSRTYMIHLPPLTLQLTLSLSLPCMSQASGGSSAILRGSDKNNRRTRRRLRPAHPCTLVMREVEYISIDGNSNINNSSSGGNSFSHNDEDDGGDDNHQRQLGVFPKKNLKDRIQDSFLQLQDDRTDGPSDDVLESKWFCELSKEDSERAGGVYYVPIEGVEQNFLLDHYVRSGMSTITASGAYIDEDTKVMHIPPGASMSVGKPLTRRPAREEDEDSQERRERRERGRRERGRRELVLSYDKYGTTSDIYSRSLGNRKVLVVRVIASDRQTSATAAQLSDSIFGTSGDAHNLKSQYEACSGGAVTISPATGNNIVNGVATVTITQSANGRPMSAVETDVTAAATNLLGNLKDGQWDFVMFCLPPGVTGGYVCDSTYNLCEVAA
jgi:hypothetical protein